MDGISGISGVSSGAMPIQPANLQPAAEAQTAGQPAPANAPLVSADPGSPRPTPPDKPVAGGQMMASLSSLSINQSSEMLYVSQGSQGAIANNELLGAVLLLLILQYMQSQNEDEKKGLLSLAMAVAQMQQGSGNQSTMLYSASSLSIESTQMMMTDAATNAYTNAGATPTQSGDPGAGGLDVTA